MYDVIIHATEEFPTVHDGCKGTVWKQHSIHKEFFLVWVHGIGKVFYFHESQLDFQ